MPPPGSLACAALLALAAMPCGSRGRDMKIVEPTAKPAAATTAPARLDGVEAHGSLKGHIAPANL